MLIQSTPLIGDTVGTLGGLGLVSSLTRVRDSGSFFSQTFVFFCAWELDAVRIIGVSATRVYHWKFEPRIKKRHF